MIFGRRAKATIGRVQIETDGSSGIRMSFRAEKTNAPMEPQTLELQILNLSAETRGRLDGDRTPVLPIDLEAGYIDDIGTIYSGQTVSIGHEKKDLEWVTKIRAGFMGPAKVPSSRSMAPGVSAGAVLQSLIEDMGRAFAKLDLSQVKARIKAGDAAGAWAVFTRGFSFSGAADEQVACIARDHGLEFAIVDGVAQLLAPDEVLPGLAVSLSAASGLIGSPEIVRDQVLTVVGTVAAAAKPGAPQADATRIPIVRGSCFLSRRIIPGAQLLIDSTTVKGRLKVLHCVSSGDTHQGEWKTEWEARTL